MTEEVAATIYAECRNQYAGSDAKSKDFLRLVTNVMIDNVEFSYKVSTGDSPIECLKAVTSEIQKNVMYAHMSYYQYVADRYRTLVFGLLQSQTAEHLICNTYWQNYVLTVYHVILHNIERYLKLMCTCDPKKFAAGCHSFGKQEVTGILAEGDVALYAVQKAMQATFAETNGYGTRYATKSRTTFVIGMRSLHALTRQLLVSSIGTDAVVPDLANIGLDPWFIKVVSHGQCLLKLIEFAEEQNLKTTNCDKGLRSTDHWNTLKRSRDPDAEEVDSCVCIHNFHSDAKSHSYTHDTHGSMRCLFSKRSRGGPRGPGWHA